MRGPGGRAYGQRGSGSRGFCDTCLTRIMCLFKKIERQRLRKSEGQGRDL